MHKISKASETTDLDLYLTDPSDSTEHAERLPHPTMSLFIKPQLNRYPKLAQGREVSRGKPTSKSSAAGRKAQGDVPDEFEDLRQQMAKANKEKQEHSYVWLGSDGSCGGLMLTCLLLVPKSSMLRSVALAERDLLPK